MTAVLHDEVASDERFAADQGSRTVISSTKIYHICTVFEHRWIEDGPISILCPIYALVVIKDDCFPFLLEFTEVPADEMEGLAEIMAGIEQETGVRFVVARV